MINAAELAMVVPVVNFFSWIGFLIGKKNIPLLVCSIVALVIGTICLWIAINYPNPHERVPVQLIFLLVGVTHIGLGILGTIRSIVLLSRSKRKDI